MRARVGGIVLKRRFEEGSRVTQGQSLFLIDPEPVRARVGSARAEVAVAKARAEEARRQPRSRAAAVREERCQPEPARRSSVGLRSRAGEPAVGRVAAAHGAARPRIHRRARADHRPDEPRNALRGQPDLDRTGVEPADQDRPGRSAVRRVRRAGGRGGDDPQRSRACEQERAAAGREAGPGGRQRVSAAGAGHLRRQLRGPWARAPCTCAPCCRTRTRSSFPASSSARRSKAFSCRTSCPCRARP